MIKALAIKLINDFISAVPIYLVKVDQAKNNAHV